MKVGSVHSGLSRGTEFSNACTEVTSLVTWGHCLTPLDIGYSIHLIAFIPMLCSNLERECYDHVDFEYSGFLGELFLVVN